MLVTSRVLAISAGLFQNTPVTYTHTQYPSTRPVEIVALMSDAAAADPAVTKAPSDKSAEEAEAIHMSKPRRTSTFVRVIEPALVFNATTGRVLLLLLFLTFSALVANPKKTTLHDGQSCSWSAEQEKRKKEVWQRPPPPPPSVLVRRKFKN